MDNFWWYPHMFTWMWIFPVSFLVVCLFFLFAFIARGPHWFNARKDRRELGEAAREILDRRYAGGEITGAQYEEMKRVLTM